MVDWIASLFRSKAAQITPEARVEVLAREIMPTILISQQFPTHESRIRESFRLARIWFAESIAPVEVE